jgi:hypothetical protein
MPDHLILFSTPMPPARSPRDADAEGVISVGLSISRQSDLRNDRTTASGSWAMTRE